MPKRSKYCGELRASDTGNAVVLEGWVRKSRNFGGCLFVDLRDREGVAQVVFKPEVAGEPLMKRAGELRPEWVVRIGGEVLSRGENVNANMPTGEVEVAAASLEVLSRSEVPPFPVEDEINATEVTRLTHRALDLRRPPVQRMLLERSRITRIIREYFADNGFVDVETPFLTRSTPEGARDYLVPSREDPKGRFYALPQSPQIFKQLLMVAGFDRYMQIVRCFRDEDLRADRQPEFTQVDVEMSFVEPEDVRAVIDGLFQLILKKIAGHEITLPVPCMTYEETISRYGVDNPDVRFGLELLDLTDAVRGGGFGIIDSAIEAGGEVCGLRLEGVTFSRKQVDALAEVVRTHGAKGLLWLRKEPGGWAGPAKKLAPEALEAAGEAAAAAEGDTILFVADSRMTARTSMGRLRVHLARQLGIIPENSWGLVWVTDFPLLEHSEEEDRWVSMHHPFTSPRPEDMDRLTSDPGSVRARSYDIVLNGQEVGGGSIRIHDREMQTRIFRALGIGDEEAEEKFGFLLRSLRYGAPPHGGIALGLDRLVGILLGAESLRDVIAFPKTTSASCLLSGAPSTVAADQLAELGLMIEGGVKE
ncbi:MAG: aspartate--tRNA ligase [Deltaproteobacteria bacterium]|nr:aspartate--tRNA ligase [Deltaproteobacteria bacterium]